VKRLGIGALVGGIVSLLVLATAAGYARWGSAGQSPFDTVELTTYNWRMARTARPETARQEIALVEIDEDSLRNLQPNAGRWPWPRVVHSILIDFLADAKAKLIVYDVNFAEADTRVGFKMGGDTWSGEESDKALVDSVKRAGNVIMLADASYEGTVTDPPKIPSPFRIDGAGIVERDVVFPPFAALADASSELAHNLFLFDRDGPMRHIAPFVRAQGRVIPSLGTAAALRIAGIQAKDVRLDGTTLWMGERAMPMAWNRVASTVGDYSYLWALINYRGPAYPRGVTYKSYSFFDLMYSYEQLAAGKKPNVDPALFKDKIVYVGISANGLADRFETPFGLGTMPGIQIHAAVADDILSSRFLHPIDGRVRVVSVLAVGLISGMIAVLLPAWWATAVTAAAIFVFGYAAMRIFALGYWVDVTQPFVASSLALLSGVGYQYFVEGREKRKMKKLFGQYVSKDVYDHLVSDPTLAKLGGTRREMSVLFSDIRGFTTVSERGQPEEIVHTLNEYFTKMVEIVFAHQGTVDKFVGDMVMALFGAPLPDDKHAEHAVRAALDMIDELGRLNAQWRAEGRPTLDIGVGINSGPMIAGNIGSEQIMSYTVIGDAVNLGSRLESLNKNYGTRIIISEATKEQLIGQYNLKPLGDVVVKGKTKPVAIFQVIERQDPQAAAAPAQTADPSVDHATKEGNV
jgi:adenylate cyclase